MKLHRLFFLPALCLLSAAAHADIYGFVDEQGIAHLAEEKVDERYELFARGEARTDLKLSSELKSRPEKVRVEDQGINKRLQDPPRLQRFDALVAREAQRQKLEPALVKAVIAVESAYDPDAVSAKGATGLMQLIPDTATRYGVRQIADPQDNVRGGTRYLRYLLDLFDGNLVLALAGFNAGEGAVQHYRNTVPPYPETQAYVKLVMRFYEHFGGAVKKVGQLKDGRVRLALPPRRGNLPPDGVHVPGLMSAPQSVDAAGEATGRP
ncbi:Lytic transglycosylase catalytic [Candidatus Accumulibacter aalborgensis]|uniref:Lytic transglycosylase catalytic n=1 Tax=Candidatus Accumulibacter aalborgensis TaxID=1860102 RepID=A0A1A8XR34_9PROT|nr:lytic transglycosylase domain-containing protein [Candidatus Accumulibacter aalborgensis]SBT06423.1 Lytic transglycosylase catalytic [Candidatus Accumulibacter aalborgensis]